MIYFLNKRRKKGATILEILIAVAVLGVLVAIVLPQFSQMRENQALKSAVINIVSAMHTAQAKSLASVNLSEYGVRLEPSRVIIFAGTSFSEGAAGNEITNIISPASISNVTLNSVSGSSGDFYFGRLDGSPSKIGTVTVSANSLSKVITISVTGAISFN